MSIIFQTMVLGDTLHDDKDGACQHSFHHEARLCQQLSSAHWALSTQSMPRQAVDVDHIILNGLSFNVHTQFWQNLQNWTKSDKQTTFTFWQENQE